MKFLKKLGIFFLRINIVYVIDKEAVVVIHFIWTGSNVKKQFSSMI